MPVSYVEPTVTENDRGTRSTHPCYGQIGASRISGSKCLYGSEFRHQHYITIKIAPSEHQRMLANDWYHGMLVPYIEVDLSEAQWATFISTLNMGEGTPCTVTDLNGKQVPQIPEIKPKQELFSGEMKERLESGKEHLKELMDRINGLKISDKVKEELRIKAQQVGYSLGVNVKFVSEQFGEHMEKVTSDAKAEIEGFLGGIIHRTGITALANARPFEMLTGPIEEKEVKSED